MINKTIRVAFFLIVLLSVFFVALPLSSTAVSAQVSSSLIDPLTIPKWENQLAAPPPVYQPTIITENGKVVRYEYTVTMSSFKEKILPSSMNLLTTVWGYGGQVQDALTGAPLGYFQSSPGPTFEAVRGIPVQVKWVNNITTPYLFAVDPTIHWADPNNYGMPIKPLPSFPPGDSQVRIPAALVTHLHGGETQSYYDGTPNQWFTANGIHGSDYSTLQPTDPNAAIYYYDNLQQPTTLWYHDHALGVTRITVNSGLAGFYLIRASDSNSDYVSSLLPSGAYEMPLIIQDRSFYTDGSLYFPTVGDNPEIHPYWFQAFLGDTIMVNGKVWPNMNVDKGQYRFRLLDASNSRVYILSLENAETGDIIPFTQIGSDGGYLKTSASITSLTLAPGERADILVDFSAMAPGTKILLKNSALVSINPTDKDPQTVGQIVQFTVSGKEGFSTKTLPTLLNPTLTESTFPNLPAPSKTRILTLDEVMGPNGISEAYLNGQQWDGIVSETPVIGSTEDWSLVDLTGSAHSIHTHLVQFQIVSRQSINVTKYNEDWINLQRKELNNQTAVLPWPIDFVPKQLDLGPYLIGNARAPISSEQGWKDTVLVYLNEVVTVRIRFASQDGTQFSFDATQGPGYVWHCHLLDHEDNEMMRPYKVMSLSQQASTFPILQICLLVVAAIIVIIVILAFLRRNQLRKRRIQIPHSIHPSKPLTAINPKSLAFAGLLVVLISWLIYSSYWAYKFWLFTPNIGFNIDIFSSLSLVFLAVGTTARSLAALIAIVAFLLFIRAKRALTARRLLVLAIVLEAFYLVSYFPTAGVGPHIGDPVLVVEATIPSIVEAVIVPVPLFMVAFKLSKGEKSYKDAIRWGCISGVAYLFVFWVRFSVQWFATFIQTPNYNPFDEIGLPGHGLGYILNYPLNMFEFLLTTVGLFLLAIFLLWTLAPTIRDANIKPNLRKIGMVLLLLGGYFIIIVILFGIFNHVGGHSIWSEFFAIHNVDRWMVSLPFLAVPLMLRPSKRDVDSASRINKTFVDGLIQSQDLKEAGQANVITSHLESRSFLNQKTIFAGNFKEEKKREL